MNRSKQLKSELTTIKRQLHAARTQPPRMNPVLAGFVKGFCGESQATNLQPPQSNQTDLTERRVRGIWPVLSYRKIAEVYCPVSGQRLQQIARVHGRDILMDPDRLAQVMLARKPKTLLQLLELPSERQRIRQELKVLTETMPPPERRLVQPV